MKVERVEGWRLKVGGVRLKDKRLNLQVEISSEYSSPLGEGAGGTSAQMRVKLF